MGHQGRAVGESEVERRKKISAARQLRERIRRGEIAAPVGYVEIPDDQVRSHTHDQSEIADLERVYGLEFDHWLTVGGAYLYDYRDQVGNPHSVQEDAGLKMRVPVFRQSKAKVETTKVSEWH